MKDLPPTFCAYGNEEDSKSEGYQADNADPSALSSPKGPSESSGVHNPVDPSLGLPGDPRSVARLDLQSPMRRSAALKACD